VNATTLSDTFANVMNLGASNPNGNRSATSVHHVAAVRKPPPCTRSPLRSFLTLCANDSSFRDQDAEEAGKEDCCGGGEWGEQGTLAGHGCSGNSLGKVRQSDILAVENEGMHVFMEGIMQFWHSLFSAFDLNTFVEVVGINIIVSVVNGDLEGH